MNEGKIEQLEKRVSKIEEFIKDLKEEEKGKETLTKKQAWFFGKDGFWRWIIEKILRQKWRTNLADAMRYFKRLSAEEKEKLNQQWLKEHNEYLEELERKRTILNQ